MDDTSLVYNTNLCRFCQIPNSLKLVKTCTITEAGETYLDLLKFIFSDIIWIDNSLISLACEICLDRIKEAAEFKKICLDTNKRRNGLSFHEIKVETEIETNDQKIGKNEDVSSVVLQNKRTRVKKRDAQKNTLNQTETTKNSSKRLRKQRPKKIKVKERLEQTDLDYGENHQYDSTNNIDDSNVEDDKNIDGVQEIDSTMNSDQAKEHICRVCKRQFAAFERLKMHTEKVHPKHLFYHCETCHETFPTKDYCDRHEFKHHGIKKFVCTSCGAKYITRSDLTHHMDIHRERAIYACKICPGKTFQSSSSLTKHKMLVHKDPKEYKHLCTECGIRFPMSSGLKVHLLRHANIRKFNCHLCDKTFCTRSELKNHAVCHSNVRPFKCDLCSAEYKLKSVLQKHKTKVHGIGNYKHQILKKYNCAYCSKIISSKYKLQRHIRTHTGVKPFKCRLCDTKFTCKSYVKGHVKGKHNVDVDATDFNVQSYYDNCEVDEENENILLNNLEQKPT